MCIEYETTRALLPSGPRRTQAMNQTVTKMRALGPSVAILLDELKASESVGNRLFAIAIMQMEPAKADIEWLLARFHSETPFIFFNAATALRGVSRQDNTLKRKDAVEAEKKARDIVNNFPGVPDATTISVLDEIVG